MSTEPPQRGPEHGTRELPVLAVLAELPEVPPPPRRRPRPRRVALPVMLFLLTCYSTYVAGATLLTHGALNNSYDLNGLFYMGAVMGILLAHEMGHFVQALRYHVPASLPFFIPMPFTLIGTMGAVIGMQGSGANRKELFDIGLSGPWAGLIVAIPVTMVGILNANFVVPPPGTPSDFADPLMFQLLIPLLRPELPAGAELVMNPFLMAGWVGMLITGLNMLPVSQLDGGHVTYALFGKRAHYIARGFLLFAAAYVVLSGHYVWTIMLVLVILIGSDHPPTANDRAPMGPLRWIIGVVSLIIPILCFMPNPMPSLTQ